MNVSTRGTPTLCRRCGQFSPGISGSCAHCGSPLAGPVAPAPRIPSPVADGPVHRFAPATVDSGPAVRLSRKVWIRVGAAGGALVLALAVFLLVYEPPSPSGAVRDYLEALGDGDAATALDLSGYGTGISPEEAPLLVPEVLAEAADRPSGITVTSSGEWDADGRYSVVSATYRLGEQTVQQTFGVVATEDGEHPYRLEQPFLYLWVNLPDGMGVTVNGIPVEASAVSAGTPVFPAAYRAATSGNTLFAGVSGAASYGAGRLGTVAEIDLTGTSIAPGAEAAVQTAAETYLNTNCVTIDTYRYGCPLRAPVLSWSQTTTWTVGTFPRLRVTPSEGGRVRFSTGTAGSADYRTTYTEFGGTEKTETGTVPIDISGSARIGDDGAITITLGY